MLLAVETSSRLGGVAGVEDGVFKQICRFAPDKPASEWLIPYIRDIINALSAVPKDIAAFAVSIGPGSFTGLRVGLSAVKTLASHLNVPVFPVSSLQVLAKAAGSQPFPVAAIMDARKHEVYGAYFETTPSIQRLSNDAVMSIDTFLNLSPSKSLFLIGDAIETYQEKIEKSGLQITYASPETCYPSPVHVGESALAGEIPSISYEEFNHMMPVYLRKSEAEVNWEKRFGLQSR